MSYPRHLNSREWALPEIETWDESRLERSFPALRSTRTLGSGESDGGMVTKVEFHDTSPRLTWNLTRDTGMGEDDRG